MCETAEEAAQGGELAGRYDTVPHGIADLHASGVDHLVLSAPPSLEEAYRIGQFVLPRDRTRIAGLRAAA